MNFYDILLGRQICCDKTEYETLVVTENREYSAPQGKAWNKVVAEVSGGGDCEFTTATVHIVNSTGSAIIGYAPYLYEIDGVTYAAPSPYTEEEEEDFTLILYRNNGAILNFENELFIYTTSGNIERIEPDFPSFIVTGDCTVTISRE